MSTSEGLNRFGPLTRDQLLRVARAVESSGASEVKLATTSRGSFHYQLHYAEGTFGSWVEVDRAGALR